MLMGNQIKKNWMSATWLCGMHTVLIEKSEKEDTALKTYE
jgi:hypothetical protein